MQNEILINKLITNLKKDGITQTHESINNNEVIDNFVFTNDKNQHYIIALSIIERYSGNQAVYYTEEGEGKNKTMVIHELTDEIYYERLRQLIKHLLK